MNRAGIEKDLSESIALLKRIQDAIDGWNEKPQENAHDLGKAFGDRDSTAQRIATLCEDLRAVA